MAETICTGDWRTLEEEITLFLCPQGWKKSFLLKASVFGTKKPVFYHRKALESM